VPDPRDSGVIDSVELWDGATHRGAVRLSWRDGVIDASDTSGDVGASLWRSGLAVSLVNK